MWACSRRILSERIAVGPLTTGRVRCFSRYLRGFRPGVLASNYVNTSTTIKNHSLWSWGHLFSVLDVRISLTLRDTQHQIVQDIAIVLEPVYHDEEHYTIRKHRKYFPRQHDRWNRRFQELVEYKTTHGHCNVPQEYPINKQLGTWVKDQRVQYKNGLLSKDRVSLLNSIGFVWDPNATQWDGMHQQLQEYKAKHGNCNVPKEYPENQKLAYWVRKQRHQYTLFQAGNKASHITQDRIDKLNAVDFVWDPNATQWDGMYQQLQEYKAEHGDCDVPQDYPANQKLAYWVKKQKHQYTLLQAGKASHITQERIDKLNAVDFVWDPNATQWDDIFQQLQEYKTEHGDCIVPVKSKGRYKKLGIWVDRQRIQFKYLERGKESSMTQERIEKLDSVGFVWNPLDAMWEESFEKLRQYQEAHKDCNDPHLDPQLRRWVKRQRSEYQKFVVSESTSMSEERMERMEKLGFDWDYESTTVYDHVPRFGDPITDTRDDRLIRFFFQNLNGISPENNFSQAGIYGKQLKDSKVDVACLCETNTDFSQLGVLENIEEQVRQSMNERVQLQASSSNLTFATVFQPGGTLIAAAGDCTLGTSTNSDKRGLGRWSSITFGGALTIFNSYRVCNQSESAGDKTAYMQQVYLLRKEGIMEPNPRQEHFSDLSQAIKDCKDEGQEVVLLMDANETLKSRGNFAQFVEDLELTEPIKDRFASQTNPVPSTYERGPNQIDFMFTTSGINEYIHRCGYLGFDEVIESDHRGLFFDLDLEAFLRKNAP